jgi:hypothetical protein
MVQKILKGYFINDRYFASSNRVAAMQEASKHFLPR